jgi:flagellar biosynthesis chaperone FliJ
MGIYGFLSAAYQETASKAGNIDAQIALIETKRDNIKEQLAIYTEEKTSINRAVSDLRSGLSNNVIQYTDTLGNILTTTSSSTRRALEKQLDQAIGRQTEINSKVDDLNQQLFDYETEIVEVTSNANITGELGPLKYLAGLTGLPMDRIINYLLLTIIFVFDPLAIALVIAANFAFEQLKTKKNVYGETVPRKKVFEVLDAKSEEWDEERMNIIGQNGNDGVHYDLEEEKPEVKIVEKIVEVPVEVPIKVENDDYNDSAIAEALKHARRARKQ